MLKSTIIPKSVIIYWLLAVIINAKLRLRVSTPRDLTQKLETVTTSAPLLYKRKNTALNYWAGGRRDALITLVFLHYFHEKKFQSALFFKSAN